MLREAFTVQPSAASRLSSWKVILLSFKSSLCVSDKNSLLNDSYFFSQPVAYPLILILFIVEKFSVLVKSTLWIISLICCNSGVVSKTPCPHTQPMLSPTSWTFAFYIEVFDLLCVNILEGKVYVLVHFMTMLSCSSTSYLLNRPSLLHCVALASLCKTS